MDQRSLFNAFLQLRVDVDASRRYYDAMLVRGAFGRCVVRAIGALSTLSTFAVASGGSPFSLIGLKSFATISSICSCLSLADLALSRVEWYQQKKKAISDLMGMIPFDEKQYSVDTLEKLNRKRLEIESDEVIVFGCLFVICQNESYEDFGQPERKRELTWMQSHVWQYLPLSYKPRAGR